MRENESHSGDGWPEPQDYIGPWAARGEDEAGQDTIAFGGQAGEAGGPGQGFDVQRGNLGSWYGGDRDESRYGSHADPGPAGGRDSGGGYGPAGGRDSGGGYGPAGGHGPGGGYGSAGGRGPGGGGRDPDPPRRARRRGHLLVYLTVAVLAACVGAGLTVAFDRQGAGPSAGASASDIPSPHDNTAGNGSALNPAAVQRKVEPGLVDITAQLKYASETAEGTGMILSQSGLVLTNNHVIDGATEVKVSLADNPNQLYSAKVMGYDRLDDVALLKLFTAANLTTVSFGNSSQVRVGMPVLALGDAEGRGRVTPAPGEISGLDRSIQASDEGSDTVENLNHMLQTNAQIQQGDSGGALADNAGQVIGMITAANTGPGGTMGFAIPINTALVIARQIANGRPSSTVSIGLPGFLGVEVSQSNSANPQQQAAAERQSGSNPEGPLGGSVCVADGQEPGVPGRIAPASAGALILGVLCGTAAQVKGLAPGDVITSVDGQAVSTPASLTDITAGYHPGDVVSVTWEAANGSRHTALIVLGDGPAR